MMLGVGGATPEEYRSLNGSKRGNDEQARERLCRKKPFSAVFAIGITSIALLMIANFLGELTLPAGVLGHEGSTLLVTLNGLRLLKW